MQAPAPEKKSSPGRSPETLVMIAAVAAVCVQIQITLFETPAYAGLRISLADLLLPLAGALAGLSLLNRKSRWPGWRSRYTPILLSFLIAAMTISIIQAWLQGGENLIWALVNKYCGFLILLAYLMLGAWLRCNENGSRIIETFTRAFVGFFILTLALSALFFFIQPVLHFPLFLSQYPWDGFMANRNAFALLAVFGMLLILNTRTSPPQNTTTPEPITRRIVDPDLLLWLLLPMFFIYNASRAGWLTCAAITLVLIAKAPKRFAKADLTILFLGIILAYGSLYVQTIRDVQKNSQLKYLLALGAVEDDSMYKGDRKRLIALEDGLELYWSSNPLTGAGLGAYKDFQISKRGKFIDLIDFTALWLLVETGLIGLLAFCAFFLHSTYKVWEKAFPPAHAPPSAETRFNRALFFFLLAFAAISFLHEIMYTRFLWLALGLALACPQESKPDAIQTKSAAKPPA